MRKTDEGKVRFNIIDFIIIVVVIGCIAGVVIRFNVVDKLVLDTKRDEVKISFAVAGISPQIANSINDGDEFYVVGSEELLGTLLSHSLSNAHTVVSNENGYPVESYDETLRDVRGVFAAAGVSGEDGFLLGGTLFLAPGKTLSVESRNVRISLIIREISSD